VLKGDRSGEDGRFFEGGEEVLKKFAVVVLTKGKVKGAGGLGGGVKGWFHRPKVKEEGYISKRIEKKRRREGF